MFGYVRPFIPELKVCENEIYRAIYCGLCKQLGRSYSQLSRLMLRYDIVFLVLFSLGLSEENVEFKKQNCLLHPLKKELCLEKCSSLEKAADISVIFAYFKFVDNVKDEKFFKRFMSNLNLLTFKNMFQKAATRQSEISNIIENFMNNQINLENSQKKSIDQSCDPTAKCLGLVAQTLSNNPQNQKILYRIGYMLGRYIYLMDALDDIDKDFKSKTFNPFLAENAELNAEKKSKIFENALLSLNFSIAQLAESFERLQIEKYKSIIKKIIYFGLRSAIKKVFEKHGQPCPTLFFNCCCESKNS